MNTINTDDFTFDSDEQGDYIRFFDGRDPIRDDGNNNLAQYIHTRYRESLAYCKERERKAHEDGYVKGVSVVAFDMSATMKITLEDAEQYVATAKAREL